MPGTLTLIGSGEFLPGLVAVQRGLLARLAPLARHAVFLDTPAGFQANADELSQTAREFFHKELDVNLNIASLRHSNIPAGEIQTAKDQLAAANYIVAGPGSPTYAIRHWRATGLDEILKQRLAAGAHLVFASSAAIALSRHALPVYEIYKVGDDPYWLAGLDLLNFEVAFVPHWNNREPRCFVGLDRFNQLAAQVPEALIIGVDENTAITFDFGPHHATVAGQGAVTLQYQNLTKIFSAGTAFDFSLLSQPSALASVAELAPVNSPPVADPRSEAKGTQTPETPTTIPDAPPALYVPPALHQWAALRDEHRAAKNFAESDKLRDRIAQVGYALKDSPSGPLFTLTLYANSNAVPSHLDKPDAVEWSVTLLAHNNAAEILRAARSVLAHAGEHPLELILVDDASDSATRAALADFACADERVRLIHLKDPLGEGAGRNAGFRAARGANILLLGGHVEIVGDGLTPLSAVLADDAIGATGSNGLVTTDLFTFTPAPTSECDAIEFYLFAFRRERLKQVGLLDEKFVFYRNLDLDWSLAFKAHGLRLIANDQLPLTVHEHPYLRLDPVERDKLSKKNYRKFLDKWKGRTDLLLNPKP